jgi:hypothetical protein
MPPFKLVLEENMELHLPFKLFLEEYMGLASSSQVSAWRSMELHIP